MATSCTSSSSSGSPVGMSPEMARAEHAVGSVVMGKDGLGSAGPPHPSWMSSLAVGACSSSRVGVLKVGVVEPRVPADSAVMLRGGVSGCRGLPRGPACRKRMRSTFLSFFAFCHWNLSPIVGSWLNRYGLPVALVCASMRTWNLGQALS